MSRVSVAWLETMSLVMTDFSSPSGWTVTGFSIASLASEAIAVMRCLPSATEELARKSNVPRVASPAATSTFLIAAPSNVNQTLRLYLEIDRLRAIQIVTHYDRRKISSPSVSTRGGSCSTKNG